MTDNLRDKMRNWLQEEGIQFNLVEDAENDYHLHFWFSRGLQLDLVLRNDKITISVEQSFLATTLNIVRTDPTHLNKLDLDLHHQDARFAFSYSNTNNAQLVGIRIFKDIWAESLSKTSFFEAATMVEHSHYIVIINERQLAINR